MKALKCDADLARDIENLIKIETQFQNAHDLTGAVSLRQREGGYGSLVRIIIGQQVSVAAAEAISARLKEADLITLETIKKVDVQTLKSHGLSSQKSEYLLGLANAEIDFEGLTRQSDEQVFKVLTAQKGIGPWSAQIYLMFALGRADVFAPADLALQESTKLLFELDARPSTSQMSEISENWTPFRNAAAQLLWAYYHVMNRKDGIGV